MTIAIADLKTQIQNLLDGVISGTSDEELLEIGRASVGMSLDRTIFDAEVQLRIDALDGSQSGEELLVLSRTLSESVVYQEPANSGPIKFKVGDKVYLGDGRLVPWDIHCPSLQKHRGERFDSNTANPSSISNISVNTHFVHKTSTGYTVVISNNDNATTYGNTGVHVKSMSINKTTLALTQSSVQLLDDYTEIVTLAAEFLTEDGTYAYYLAIWHNSTDTTTKAATIRCKLSDGIITTSSVGALYSGLISPHIRFLDVTNKVCYIATNDAGSARRFTFDHVAETTPGSVTTVTYPQMVTNGWPAPAYTSDDFSCFDPVSNSAYFFEANGTGPDNDIGTARAYYNLYKINSVDGDNFTYVLLVSDIILPVSNTVRPSYLGNLTWAYAYGSMTEIIHYDATNATVFSKENRYPNIEESELYGTRFSISDPQKGLNIGGDSADDRALMSGFAADGSIYYHGERFINNKLVPGYDWVLIYSACNTTIPYGASSATVTAQVQIILDSDNDYIYGVMIEGTTIDNTTKYNTFKISKPVTQMSKGPIGIALTASAANGDFILERYKGTEVYGATNITQMYAGQYYPSIMLEGTFDFSFMGPLQLRSMQDIQGGIASPTSLDVVGLDAQGPVQQYNVSYHNAGSTKREITNYSWFDSSPRGRYLLVKKPVGTSISVSTQAEVGVI